MLIAKGILFKKLHIMPKGQSPKVTGVVCNVPDTIHTIVPLLHQAVSNGLVIVKFKCKLEYRVHVNFESVRPYVVNQLLQHLKLNN